MRDAAFRANTRAASTDAIIDFRVVELQLFHVDFFADDYGCSMSFSICMPLMPPPVFRLERDGYAGDVFITRFIRRWRLMPIFFFAFGFSSITQFADY